jgi:hypothetical protein
MFGKPSEMQEKNMQGFLLPIMISGSATTCGAQRWAITTVMGQMYL